MYARGGLVSYPYYAGDLDEIRISEVIRYSSSFTPPSAPFSTDGDTLALYPLDEGSGQTAADTSGNSADLTLGTSGSGESADPAWMTAAGYAPDLTTGLVAAYGFDEGTGGTTADATANALDGTISGASWTSSGYDGNALTFDGVDDWVTVADAAALDLTDGMTLAAWVYPTTLGDWRTVVFKEDTAGFAYALDADADGASPAGYLATNVNTFEALDDAALSANTWTYIAVTYDGANLVLYVNGAVAGVTPASGTIVTTSGVLRMGGNSPWGEYFAGRIDSVRVYDRALSPSEVALSGSVAIGDEASVGGGGGGGSPTPSVRSISYSYDGLLRLTEAAESPGAVYTYTYDLAGNRTSAWVDSLLVQSASYNDANQVVGWTYDATGNLISTGVVTYTYDALNRQIARDSVAYDYNGDGVLVALDDGALTRYVQDLASPLPVILDDGAAQYVYGHERLFGDDGSDRTWYLGDALGSVRMTLDAAGVPLAGLNYDPWGTPQSTTIAPFGFTGEPQDAAGNVYLRARWYTPGTGTFVGWRWRTDESNPQVPPSNHTYAYSLNNPISNSDPSGKCVPEYIEIGGVRYTIPGGEPGCIPISETGAGLNWDDGGQYLWDLFQGMGSPGALAVDAAFGTNGWECIWSNPSTGKNLGITFTAVATGGGVYKYILTPVAQYISSWLTTIGITGGGAVVQSVWQQRPFERGVVIEQRLGANLPSNFPVIDRFQGGVATSIKSLNLNAASYQSIPTLRRTVLGYLNKVSTYQGQPNAWANVQILPNHITGRALDLAIPASGATPAQMQALQALQARAATMQPNPVTLNIIPIP